MNADRNLLFGVLALQLNLVTQSQLVAGMHAWVADKSQSLSAHLIRLGHLPAESAALLEPLVAKHVEQHGNDAAQSLAAISSVAPLLSALAPLTGQDSDVATSVAHFSAATEVMPALPQSGSDQPTISSPVFPTQDGRFRILRPHAEGGLGKVSVAQDGELGREVALKEIKSAYADDGHSRGRFVLEAEITGGLEHPGIVPVYGLGTYADGRPFYAMRFIQGDSLKERIDRFHGRTPGTPGPASDSDRNLQLRELLGRFIDVCQAVEYAHSRGVLHRDLKPDNIMLGKYGETLVVDWGLAKAQGKEFPSVGTPLIPASQSGSGLLSGSASQIEPTLAGSVLGTLAYMSPEQAAGKIDDLGTATDTYSLGATLYHLLTGRAPFSHWKKEVDQGTRLRDVQAGRFPRPHEVAANIPPALEAVCLKAMANDPAERYDTLGALTADVEHWLADEPVSAWPEPLARRAARWARKHPALVTGGVSTVLVASLALVALTVVTRQKNAELLLANNRERVAAQEAQKQTLIAQQQSVVAKNQSEIATQQRSLAQARQLEAEQHALAAKQQSQLALQTLSSVIFGLNRGLENIPGGGEARRKLLQSSLQQLDKVATRYIDKAVGDRLTAVALRELGTVVLRFGSDSSSRPEGDRDETPRATEDAVQLATRLCGAAHVMFRQLATAAPEDSEAQRDLSLSYDILGNLANRSGDNLAAREAFEKSLEIRQKLAAAAPENFEAQRDLSAAYDNIGMLALRHEAIEAARQAYSQSLEIRRRQIEDEPDHGETQRDLAIALSRMGDVELAAGDLQAARATYGECLEIYRKLRDAAPNNAQAQRDLAVCYDSVGSVHLRTGDVESARKAYSAGLAIYAQQAAIAPNDALAQSDLAVSHNYMGALAFQEGNLAEARDAYRQSLEIRLKLVAQAPTDSQAQRDLARSYNDVGRVEMRDGKLPEARDAFEKALEIFKKQADTAPEDSPALRDLFDSYSLAGQLARQAGEMDVARIAFGQSLEIARKLAVAAPRSADVQRDLSVTLNKLGDLALQTGDLAEARDNYKKGLVIAEQLAAIDSTDARAQRDLSASYEKLGDVAVQLADLPEARGSFQKSLAIRSKLSAATPSNREAQRDLAVAYERVGDVSLQSGDRDSAMTAYQSSLKIFRHLAETAPMESLAQRSLSVSLNKWGDVLFQGGDLEAAKTTFEESLAISRKLLSDAADNEQAQRGVVVALNRVGDVALEAGERDRAVEIYGESLEFARALATARPADPQSQRDLMVGHIKIGRTEIAHYRFDAARMAFLKAQAVLTGFATQTGNQQFDSDLKFIEEELANCKLFEEIIADLDVALKQPPDQQAMLLSMRLRAFLQRVRETPDELLASVEEASKTAVAFAGQEPTSQSLFSAACAHALCVAELDAAKEREIAGKSEGPAHSPAAIAAREQALGAAMKNLTAAIDAGFDNRDHLEQAPELNSLRNLPEFQEIAKRLESAPPAK